MFSCGSFCNMHDNFENNLSAESKPTALLLPVIPIKVWAFQTCLFFFPLLCGGENPEEIR